MQPRPPIYLGVIPLEKVCDQCEGSGLFGTGKFLGLFEYNRYCDQCHGVGAVLNEDGKKICDLVASHLTVQNEQTIVYK